MNKKLLTEKEKAWEIMNWFIEKVEKLEVAYGVNVVYNVDSITNKSKPKKIRK